MKKRIDWLCEVLDVIYDRHDIPQITENDPMPSAQGADARVLETFCGRRTPLYIRGACNGLVYYPKDTQRRLGVDRSDTHQFEALDESNPNEALLDEMYQILNEYQHVRVTTPAPTIPTSPPVTPMAVESLMAMVRACPEVLLKTIPLDQTPAVLSHGIALYDSQSNQNIGYMVFPHATNVITVTGATVPVSDERAVAVFWECFRVYQRQWGATFTFPVPQA